jgi:hypothetical protein
MMRFHRNHRRSLQATACAHAAQVGCPHASSRHPGHSAARSRWLRSTCAVACRCNARLGEWLHFSGIAGIAGFCAASLGFEAGFLSEAKYLAVVAISLGLFVASVSIAHLGDPHAWQRSECQRTSGQRAQQPAKLLSLSAARTRAGAPSIARARMN